MRPSSLLRRGIIWCTGGEQLDLSAIGQERDGSLRVVRKGGKTGYSLCSFFSKVSLWAGWPGLSGVVVGRKYQPLLQYWSSHRKLAGLVLVLDLEDLQTDSLVRAASINLEKEGKENFSKNILYFSVMS